MPGSLVVRGAPKDMLFTSNIPFPGATGLKVAEVVTLLVRIAEISYSSSIKSAKEERNALDYTRPTRTVKPFILKYMNEYVLV